MKELDTKARAFLRATAAADDPTQDDYDRVHASLSTRIALGVATGVAVTAATRAATATLGAGTSTAGATASVAGSAGASLTGAGIATSLPIAKGLGWVLAVSIAAGAAGTGAVVLSKKHSTEAAKTAVVASSAPKLNRVVDAPSRGIGQTPVILPVPEAIATAPLSPASPVVQASKSAESSLSSRALSAPPSATLEPELALIRQARQAVGRDDAAHALALLDDHMRRFPHGALSEDRDALQVFATCKAGQIDAARELAARFLTLHSESPYAAAVRVSCVSAPSQP